MTTRDIITDLVNLTHPMPTDYPGEDAHEAETDAWSEMCSEVADERDKYERYLRLRWEHEGDDPLLGEIRAARSVMLEAQKQMRVLIAYGREFVEPRPYTLDDLARAAGMSISGVRTAYDDDEIIDAARRTGAKIRRRPEDAAPVEPLER
jgi:hypothetical protein